MKKTIALVVTLLLITALLMAGYYGMGLITERDLVKNINILNKPNGLNVSIEKYKRGWFKSEAILDWDLFVPSKVLEKDGKKIFKPSKTYHTAMPLVIYHGPIIFQNMKVRFGLGAANSYITLPTKYLEQFDEEYASGSSKPTLNLDIFVSYFNNTSISLISPKFRLISKNGKTDFEWLGMVSNIEVSPNLKHVRGSLVIDGLTWFKDNINSVLKRVESDYNLYKDELGLYLGDANLYVPSILVTKEKDKLIEVSEFKLNSSSSVHDNLFNSSLHANLDKFFINKGLYSACVVDFNIRNLDAKILVDMNQKISKSKNQSDRDRQRILLSLLPDLPVLVNKGAEIDLSKFNLEMSDGNIKANLKIVLPNDNNTNPFQLVQNAKGEGKLEISSNLLKTLLKRLYKNKYQMEGMEKVASQNTTVEGNELAKAAQSKIKVDDGTELTAVSEIDAKSNLANADIETKVTSQASQKIADLVSTGVLKINGSEYMLDLQIVRGQLLINGHSFKTSMLQL